jgi:hypothetical protein
VSISKDKKNGHLKVRTKNESKKLMGIAPKKKKKKNKAKGSKKFLLDQWPWKIKK